MPRFPFLETNYSKIRKHNLGEWNMTLKFPGNVLLESIIAQNLLLVSASQLLQLLPVDTTNIEISEAIFITRYILPALQPLFDNQERNIRFEFSSTELADNHKRAPGFNGCPDCIITIFQHQTDDGANVGFGEVKRQSMAGNHYLVNWDLLRLAVFGPYITFYLIKLQADGLYILTELARLQCPMSVMEVPAYLTNFSRLKNVIHTFENLCKPDKNNDDISSWRRDSLTSTDVMFVLDKKKDRK
ncbi:hypothetical protein G6F56_008320 [Rhizopus delemar]|nr:hypothetical protein G6F56_008320 [Rhizopus delemar]